MTEEADRSTLIALAARGSVGGVLMGLANLVPGISGGTMLLAVGVYPRFIRAVAEVTTLRFRVRSLLLLACVVLAAVVAIGALAGVLMDQIVAHCWVMYSLFIGLTLGGVPLLYRMVRPVSATVIVAAVAGILAMAGLTFLQGATGDARPVDAQRQVLLLLLAGAAGGSAMILPGVSGAYLLMVLGQYMVILGAIESALDATADRDWVQLAEEMRVFIPVGVGVVIGVVGVGHLVKLFLDRFRRVTLGFLLGLLLGAVVGLWPFQVLDTVDDRVVRVGFFAPSALLVAASLGLVCVGFAASVLVCRMGAAAEDRPR
jgi:putative membrane protein